MAKEFGKQKEFNSSAFVRERDAALLSLDKATIEAYAQKYQIPFPTDEEVFWVAIHKARFNCLSLPDEPRSDSLRWLERRGYSPDFDFSTISRDSPPSGNGEAAKRPSE